MKDFIYEKEDSLSKELCETVINYFENNSKLQNEGRLGSKSGETYINAKIKKTIDITIDNKNLTKESEFFPIMKILESEIENCLKQYSTVISSKNIDLSDKKICYKNIIIHKYISNEGVFEYHNDFSVDIDYNKYRLLNFLWYLNNVDIGGETEFFNNYSIKPKQGKLVIFPSEWFFFHKGNTPISNNKYVISGWIYTK